MTRRGQPAVIVLAVDEYERLCRLEKVNAPSLAELLLDIPQDDGEFYRLPLPTPPPGPLMFLLDTDILSSLRRRDRHPEATAWLAAQQTSDLHLSAMTVGKSSEGSPSRSGTTPTSRGT